MINIGSYREIIIFGTMEKEEDGLGGFIQVFKEKSRTRGRAITSASEITSDGGIRNIYSYTFECRFIEGIRPNMLMKLNDSQEIWTVKNVIDPSGKRERLKFEAQTEVPNL